jgi:glycosyltransferase involved in cell wall biosynthesis
MMPVFNEERTLPHILGHVLARREVGELIAVDDGSTDGTWRILQAESARDSRVRPLRQESNQGKGAALRRAIAEIRMPYAIVQDADLEYDPADYPVLLRPLVQGRADAVFGARQFGGHSAYSYWFVKGGQGLTWMFNVLNNCYISDVLTGYKALRSDLWRRLNLERHGFDIDPEIAAKIVRLGYRIHEVPISYYARSRSEGKKVGVRDGFVTALTMLDIRWKSEHSLFGPGHDKPYHRNRQDELGQRHPLAAPPVNTERQSDAVGELRQAGLP